MGSLAQLLGSNLGVDDENAIRERLELLLAAAKAKLGGYKDEINEQFMNPALVDQTPIPGIRAIRFVEQYLVASKSSFKQQVSDHLTQAIDSFFSIGGNDDQTRKAVQGGVKTLITTALDRFIGGVEAGESEVKTYVIVPENNAFVRADICVWRYHMPHNPMSLNNDTFIAYLLCKSVVDHTKLRIDELIYLVSETPAARNNVPAVDVEIAMAQENSGKPPVVTKVKVLADGNGKAITRVPGSKKLTDYTPVMIDAGSMTTSVPPSIALVEAYIEELIRVWKKLEGERATP